MLNRCRVWLEPALRRGVDADLSWKALEIEAEAQRVQVWPGEASALLTQLISTPEGGRLHVWLGGGDLRDLLSMRPGIEAWARSQGCNHATIKGRKGWERLFLPFGYHVFGDRLRKELFDE